MQRALPIRWRNTALLCPVSLPGPLPCLAWQPIPRETASGIPAEEEKGGRRGSRTEGGARKPQLLGRIGETPCDKRSISHVRANHAGPLTGTTWPSHCRGPWMTKKHGANAGPQAQTIWGSMRQKAMKRSCMA